MRFAKKGHVGLVLEVHCILGGVADVVDRYGIEKTATPTSVLLVRLPWDLVLNYLWTLFCLLACPGYVYLLLLPLSTTGPLWDRAMAIATTAILTLFLPVMLQLGKLRRTRLLQLTGPEVADVSELERATGSLVLNQTCRVPWAFSRLSLLGRALLHARPDLRFWVFVPVGHSLDYRAEVPAGARGPSWRSILGRWFLRDDARRAKKFFPVKGVELLSLSRLTVFGPHGLFKFLLMALLFLGFGHLSEAAWMAFLLLLLVVAVLPLTKVWLPAALNAELGLWKEKAKS